jgi:hypothetical protein
MIDIESNFVNRASRDRVRVVYYHNWPDLPCKPYPPIVYKRRGRGGLDPSNHNTPTHTRRRIFICKEVQTYPNPHVPRVPLFFASMSTPTLKSSRKITIVGAQCGAHEIKLHESNGVSIYNQVSFRLKVVSRISWVYNQQIWRSKPAGTRVEQNHRIRHQPPATSPDLSWSRKRGATQKRT